MPCYPGFGRGDGPPVALGAAVCTAAWGQGWLPVRHSPDLGLWAGLGSEQNPRPYE